MSDTAAGEILVAGARALAHAEGLGSSLQPLLAAIEAQLDVESAAIFVVDGQPGRLRIVASVGLPDAAEEALAAAVANPDHPIARTLAAPAPTFDVLPTAPGGPALRSHLPLMVTREGSDVVLGVLAIAHDRPIDAGTRPVLEATADLATVAIERALPG